MTAELQAFALLCGLAAVAFSADSNKSGPLRIGVWALTLVPASLLLSPAVPFASALPHIGFEPTQVAMVLVIMCAVLLRHPLPWLSAAFSGLMSAVWLATLLNTGLPAIAVWPVAVGLPLAGVLLSYRHTSFSTASMREEARLIVLLSALAMTIIPAITASWQFQTTFRLADTNDYMEETSSAGFLLILLVTLVTGLIYRLISRRKLQ